MGRSVIPHPQASAIAYDYLEPDEEFYREQYEDEFEGDEDAPDFENWMFERYSFDAEYDWISYKDGVIDHIKELFPSMSDEDDYLHSSEQSIIARNSHSEISISEYCGVVAISLAKRSDFEDYYSDEISLSNLGAQWRSKVEEKFLRAFSSLNRVGGFSDGTSIYMKA